MPKWFCRTTDDHLMQGDVLPKCRLFLPIGDEASDNDEAMVTEVTTNVIVITNTCDIYNKQLISLLVAQVLTLDEAINDVKYSSFFTSSTNQVHVRDGLHSNYCMLGACDIEPFISSSIIVSFLEAYHVSTEEAKSIAKRTPVRPRLKSHFHSYLAQAFAKCYMRSGYPESYRPDIKVTESHKFQECRKYFIGLGPADRERFTAI